MSYDLLSNTSHDIVINALTVLITKCINALTHPQYLVHIHMDLGNVNTTNSPVTDTTVTRGPPGDHLCEIGIKCSCDMSLLITYHTPVTGTFKLSVQIIVLYGCMSTDTKTVSDYDRSP